MSSRDGASTTGKRQQGDTPHGSGERKRKRTTENKMRIPKPDSVLQERTNNEVKLHEDYSCMLHKQEDESVLFCLLQVACFRGKYVIFVRSGKEGEDGKWKAIRESDVKAAEKSFKKMFREKTGVGWNTRKSFVPQPGKYFLAQVDENDSKSSVDEDEEENSGNESCVVEPLDERTELMAKIVLDRDVLLDQIAILKLDINIDKMKEKMFDEAEEIFKDVEKAIKFRKPPSVLRELWKRFYKVVPHQEQERGSCPQNAVDSPEVHLFKKMELMSILRDIKSTTEFLDECGDDMSIEEMFYMLGCKVRLVDKKSDEYKLVEKYATACPNSRRGTLLDVWTLYRPQDKIRADEVKLEYRKLLWHGFNVAQTAATLRHGLRVTPFNGGNLGKGIYLTPEHAKASWNVGVHWGRYEEERNVGFMVLAEAALGRMRYIKMGNSSLTRPPDGFDSIAAKGRLEADPSEDEVRRYGGKRVIIPVGAPVKQGEFEASGFLQSQYVLYDEGQVQLRYLLKFSFA